MTRLECEPRHPTLRRFSSEYDRRVADLAAQGAQVVVLPEKIAMITPAMVAERQQHFSALARQNRLWLEVGVGIDDGKSPTNWAWLFAPGRRARRQL